ncbi:hypothetical protein TBLA_0C03230 [Henningerozyma blattae CBS 6284]|uniref:Ribonuclease H2 subunit B n=1 Tax=Henningerozyma blattae (strain ATCC 34711 / CBS 6284 / DSM 70876 / NBRC 10599 / NRRL Y-10934 / UCD 77-7) TaxID=1071380 RepID=I2H175_HENB6|nr:hypothetical protein TBLA_0C03230 [Tetrapisispora blattae CBS 6284]CCH60127.1 hypothetical protein TBLA_0C03230 [Tetrapisispora blattae CBS 6284]
MKQVVVCPDNIESLKQIVFPHPHDGTPRLTLVLANDGCLYRLHNTRLGKSVEATENQGRDIYMKSIMVSTGDILENGSLYHLTKYNLAFALCSLPEAVSQEDEPPRYQLPCELQSMLAQVHGSHWTQIPTLIFQNALKSVSISVDEAGDTYYALNTCKCIEFLISVVDKLSTHLPPSLLKLIPKSTSQNDSDLLLNKQRSLLLACDLLRSELSSTVFNLLMDQPSIQEANDKVKSHEAKLLQSRAATTSLLDLAHPTALSTSGNFPTSSMSNRLANNNSTNNKKKTKNDNKVKISKGAIDNFFKSKKKDASK